MKKNHVKRLIDQVCEVKAGVAYVDLLLHFTRIADHAKNMAEKVLEERV